ncbi:MAG: polysaccharide biosynthesis protein [Candidatus Acidiferrum sp.]
MNNKPSPLLAPYAGKCLLITGAGGFIGSALSTALAEAAPRLLVLLDNSEHNLHEVSMRVHEQISAPHDAILGDVCDAPLLADIFERHRPEIILHAAACKHVPLMETNPLAAMRTNAIGTWRLTHAVAQAAKAARNIQLLLISTDKAVKPASVMGATKRVAEMAVDRAGSYGITAQTVRLGNVFGSNGSVAPLFARQISNGGPVTVTHPEATRYFFTLDDTVKIILRTAMMPAGTFIPALPPASKIVELAERMIREAQRADSRIISIEFTALRPGDKLHEEFANPDEIVETSAGQQLSRVRGPQLDAPKFDAAMRRLEQAIEKRQLGTAIEILRELVPQCQPSAALLAQLHEASVAKA